MSFQTLESEMKKMQASILECAQGFDKTVAKLFERKVKSEAVIYQVRSETHAYTPHIHIEQGMSGV